MIDDPGVNNSTPSDLISDIPAYALGALSDDERAQVEALLANSEEARAELRVYQDMLTGLATLAPARKAPAHLTADFRQRLAAESRAEAATQMPAAQKPVVLPRRQMNRLTVWASLAAILVVVLGVIGLYRVIVADSERRTIQDILANSSAHWTDLAPQSGTTGKVSFVRLSQNPKAVLVAQLPPLPAEKQYQLWLISKDHPDSALVFSPSQQEDRFLINVPNTTQTYDAAAITVEPTGGSPGPTTKPVYVGTLTP